MDVRFSPIWSISTQKLRYYSVTLGSNADTEYAKFCSKAFPEHQIELQILRKTITKMGLRGAKPYYFKNESPAHALPIVNPEVKKRNKKDFGLRLYCIYLTPQIVILLNGDIKTHPHSPLRCPRVESHFKNAISIASKLQEAKKSDYVRYIDFDIEFDPDFEIQI